MWLQSLFVIHAFHRRSCQPAEVQLTESLKGKGTVTRIPWDSSAAIVLVRLRSPSWANITRCYTSWWILGSVV